MLDQNLIHRIRGIFLHQRPHVSISEAAGLLGWSRREMAGAISAGEVEVNSTAVGMWIWREELMGKALELWAPEVIEEALGADADGVLPEAVRLVDLHVRVRRYQAAMLAYFAERERTTVSDLLARTLDGVASAHAEELLREIAGFAEGLAWPLGEAYRPC
jgi:hypothetical protein